MSPKPQPSSFTATMELPLRPNSSTRMWPPGWMKRLAFSTRLVIACRRPSGSPSTSGASPVTSTFACRSCRMGVSVSTTPLARSCRFTRRISCGSGEFSMRCSVSRSFVRRLKRSLSLTMMLQNLSCSAGGRSGSVSISALPRMAVSGVRSSWATSLMNSFWRCSLSARSWFCCLVVCKSDLNSQVRRSASYRRPSGSNGTSAPWRQASVFFARSLSGSAKKCPISRLRQNTTTAAGASKTKLARGRSHTNMHATRHKAVTNRLNSVLSSAKYVCSRFIA